MIPELYRVKQITPEIPATFTLELEPEGTGEIPSFATGQFNMLYLFGIGEIPISISGNPTQRNTLVHTVRAVGATSRALCELQSGDIIGVRGPFGSHWPLEHAVGKDVVIMAGGLGLAPLRSAIYQLLEQRERYHRVILLSGSRTPEDILYLKECECRR
jgi:NAD(P)H-flavin reductase